MSRFDDSRDDAIPLDAVAAGEDALQRDDPLRSALREALPEPPVDNVDWTTLQARIASAASPTLAALTAARISAVASDNQTGAVTLLGPDGRSDAGPQGLLQPLAGWSPFGIPLAAAASVLLMVGAALLGPGRTASDDVAFRTIEEEFMAGLGSSAAPFLASAGADDMLDAVLFHDGEEW